jgi:hypothetical protein
MDFASSYAVMREVTNDAVVPITSQTSDDVRLLTSPCLRRVWGVTLLRFWQKIESISSLNLGAFVCLK